MAQLEILGHSTIYRNPHPNTISEYVAFPALQAVPGDGLLCMCRHGTARESPAGVVKIYRSTDGGETWQAAGTLPEREGGGEGIHLPGGFGVSPEGDVLAWVSYPLGSQGESGQLVSRSADGGLTWAEFKRVDAAPFGLIGVGGNLVTLADGRMVAASEWGEEESGDKKPDWASLITSSSDGGRTWEAWRRVHGPQDGIYFFDLRIAGLADGRLLGADWTHDPDTGTETRHYYGVTLEIWLGDKPLASSNLGTLSATIDHSTCAPLPRPMTLESGWAYAIDLTNAAGANTQLAAQLLLQALGLPAKVQLTLDVATNVITPLDSGGRVGHLVSSVTGVLSGMACSEP